ncbi:MAG: DUF192 domain-containing protein [Candidatus Doudnabacteria bacterium]|nr:DUF192 domain-containing protein [Candidatus Doudnabacteria bacterium]
MTERSSGTRLLVVALFLFLVIEVAVGVYVVRPLLDERVTSETGERELLSSDGGSDQTLLLRVGGESYRVSLAVTPEAQTRGLMDSDVPSPGEGMLFLYPDAPQTRIFWMKHVEFPLDLVWIRDGKVVGVTEAPADNPLLSDDQKPRYLSPESVDSVLEVAAMSGIQAGDRVILE